MHAVSFLVSPTIPIIVSNGRELVISRCTCTGVPIADQQRSPVTLPPSERPQRTADRNTDNSYGQILKSSALIGGSQVVNIAIGIIRTKAMAILLGPAGFGLFGLYGSVQNLTQSIAGMGINSSGVRQIAEAMGTGDETRVAQTAAVLRRTAIVLGLFGAALLVLFSRQISRLTFGSPEHAGALSLLSIAVFLALVAGGQTALIQGTRRIADLAKMKVLAAFFELCAGVPLVYFFRQKGVVPSLVMVAFAGIMTSWWYSLKIEIQPAAVTLSQVRQEASALLKLGSAFMASGLMTMGVAYGVRILIAYKIGMEATGLYQSAWALGGLYVGFILQAMGADFYPRLTASIHNHPEANRLVNEQTLIGLLLAGPGVLATLTFAPLVVALLYSTKFTASVPILRWICLGAMLQVISWPMGYIIVAKGRQMLFIFSEVAWAIVSLALAWTCISAFGVAGAGMTFFGSYIFHALFTYVVVRKISGFRWSEENLRTGIFFGGLIAIVFCSAYVLPPLSYAVFGVVAAAGTGIFSLRRMAHVVSRDQIPRSLRRFMVGLRLLPQEL
jgi:antigen flippase